MKVFEKEVIIIGSGPAGLCAAIEAASAGCKVLVIDENKRAGGQLFKQIHKFFGSGTHHAGMRGFEIASELYAQAQAAGVEFWLDTMAYGIFNDGVGIVKDGKSCLVKAEKIIVATGGSEDPAAFPGSTLPGVITAGAAQTMANIERVLPGKRIAILGSGNVGLIVAYQLMQSGAEVCAIIEKSGTIGGYGVHAAKVCRAGVSIMTGSTVVRANGSDSLEEIVVARLDENGNVKPGSEETIKVDTLCIAVGMSPMSELLWQAGVKFDYISEFGGFVPLHDRYMNTSIGSIYVAGDVTGIEEAPVAMEEGRLAGISVAKAQGHLTAEDCEKLCGEALDRLSLLEGDGRKAAKLRQLADMQLCCGKEC